MTTYLFAMLFASSVLSLVQDPAKVPVDQPHVEDHPKGGGAVIDQGEMPARPPARSQAELEAEFKEMLTGVTLEGTWQMTSEAKDGSAQALTPPRSESYTIHGAVKLTGEVWIITARIQFADKDVSIPVPVRVVWAEDTPMITLSDFSVPMLGTYSCRVIFHHGYYTGIWYSTVKNYGGIMSGRVVKDTKEPGTRSTDESSQPKADPRR